MKLQPYVLGCYLATPHESGDWYHKDDVMAEIQAKESQILNLESQIVDLRRKFGGIDKKAIIPDN